MRKTKHCASLDLNPRAHHWPCPKKDALHPGSGLHRLGRAKPLGRHFKPRKPKGAPLAPMEVLAADTIERIPRGASTRHHYLDGSRLPLRFGLGIHHQGGPPKPPCPRAFALSFATKAQKPRFRITQASPRASLPITSKDKGSLWWYTYPKSPKMNAQIERFNRTLQESFLDYHEDLLFTDTELFNRKLAKPASLVQRRASSPFPRSAISFILPMQTSPQVPKWGRIHSD